MSKAKFKPHKGLKKRVRVTAKGKVKAGRPFKSHLNSSFPGSRVRKLRRPQIISPEFAQQTLRAIGED